MESLVTSLNTAFAQLYKNISDLDAKSTRALLLSAKQNIMRNRERERIPSLCDVELQVYSQWGEDGIIDWLIHALPPMPEIFIEFGVENYQEANTRYLLQNRNWRGLIIDGSKEHMDAVRHEDIYYRHDLTATSRFITKENINAIFAANGFSGDIGILSVDIDGNDYWVWEAIHNVNPVIVICEYIAVFGDMHPISIPYAADFTRHAAHHSGQYAGASIKAFIHLAERKGYSLVGTTSQGLNAFFVRNDYAGHLKDKIGAIPIHASRFTDTRGPDGRLTYQRGTKRLACIAHLPVVNVVTGDTHTLAELDPVYSADFLRQMRGGV